MRDLDSIKKSLSDALHSSSREREPGSGGEGDSASSPARNHDDRYVLGRDPQTGEKVTVPADVGRHSLVLGVSGVGKSTFLLSQMLQDVRRGHSVFLIDPHGGAGGLTHKFLSHIPEDRWDDVVYINPMTAFDRGEVVKINFLQRKGLRPDLVREMFIDCLRRTYPKFWGPRLENILTHALMLLYDAKDDPTIEELTEVIPNRNFKRSVLLEGCTDDEIQNFWGTDYKDMDPQSYTSVMNKIYKMMTASPMTEFAKARSSTVDLYESMNEGKIVVVEISKGRMTENISAFFGSIFLSRIAQLAMQREDIPEGERLPVHVYVDEAHTFITDIIQRNMQELRKFGVLLTACSQNLQRYSDAGSENILPELADYTVAFRCGEDTAKRVGEKFSTRLGRGRYPEPWKPLTKLRDYEFYAAVPIGTSIEIRKARTIDVGVGEQDRGEIIESSLESHGEMTERRMRAEKKGDVRVEGAHIKPPEFFVLHYLDEKGADRENKVRDYLRKYRGLSGGDVLDAISRLEDEGYIGKDTSLPWDESRTTKKNNKFIWLLMKGERALYPRIVGPRAGGAEHVSMICQAMRKLRCRENELVAPVLPEDRNPDTFAAEITEVSVRGEGDEIYPDLIFYFDHSETGWPGNKKAAVEVDANPEKMEFKKHFRENRNRIRVPTLFVVGSEREKKLVERELKKEGAEVVPSLDKASAPKEAKVVTVDPEGVEDPSAVEAERSKDKRLYRQVKESCRGKRREGYLDLIESGGEGEEAGAERPAGSEREEPEPGSERAKGPSDIPKAVDRVKKLGREGRRKNLRNVIRKLKGAGCEFKRPGPGRVRMEYKEDGKRCSTIFEGSVAEEVKGVLWGGPSPARGEAPSFEAGGAGKGEPERTAEEGSPRTGEVVDRVGELVEGGSTEDLESELGRLVKTGCSIEASEEDEEDEEGEDGKEVWVKITWDENGRERSVTFWKEEAERIVEVVEGEEETPPAEETEKPEPAEEGGKKGGEQEKETGPEEGEKPEGWGAMSDRERGEWKNKSRKEKWNAIKQIAEKAKILNEEGSPARDLSEKLRALRERGCTIGIQRTGTYKYIKASKSVSGSTKAVTLGRLDDRWEEACKQAGVEL